MRKLLISVVVYASVLAAGCSTDKIPGVYRIDIQQGNVVSQEMLASLKPGMDKRQVLYVLGTPLIQDPFRKDRWDYVYTFQEGGSAREQRRVTVLFENDRLLRIEGDVVPGTATTSTVDTPRKNSARMKQGQDGLFGRLWKKVRGKGEGQGTQPED